MSWDIKRIKINVFDTEDTMEDAWLKVTIFNDDCMDMKFTPGQTVEKGWYLEGVPLDSARRLRDFLNYALPEKP